MLAIRRSLVQACRASAFRRPAAAAGASQRGPQAPWRPSVHSQRSPLTRARSSVAEAAAMAVDGELKTKYRKDYKPTAYLIDSVYLRFFLDEETTRVVATSTFKPNHSGGPQDIELDGRADVQLESVSVDGEKLSEERYERTDKTLVLRQLPEQGFELEVVTIIKPQENSSLEGLYKSSGMFCTQCEAEGFRGITYFYDRPDVMATYTVAIEGDKTKYPVLLSNGNLVDSGDSEGGRHFAIWKDPWPKPCYLFALVAGDLVPREDTFVTCTGKTVKLRIFVEPHDLDKTAWAMDSLKHAMKWDEDTFGLEYDLDLFNIVAVSDFNMGAMENKSLNVFNSQAVLATPEITTDDSFKRIQGIVAHEYFHNWTGNRVTCRDWFQLTLKEGLTVYRDEEFTADMFSRSVKRIEDVKLLRSAQFAEDAGPMSHPVRPDSYIKMDNFYTLTVYEKGAEVIRLYETVLGKEGFRKGTDEYFKRHDGSAVTCDDFLAAMADANGEDLSSLAKWYGQAGTPEVSVSTAHDAAAQTYTITVKQRTAPTKGQEDKVPLLIPIRIGLLGASGAELPFTVTSGRFKSWSPTSAVLLAEEETSTFVCSGVAEAPVPSLLRGFSAPVNMAVEGQSDADLLFLMSHDTDGFNRWDASQRLAKGRLLALYRAALGAGDAPVEQALVAAGGVGDALVNAYSAVLKSTTLDGSTAAMTLSLPTVSELMQAIPEADPTLVHKVRKYVVQTLATGLKAELAQVLESNDLPADAVYKPVAEDIARRAIKNQALMLLCATGEEQYQQDALRRFRAANNMTDSAAAIASVIHADCPARTAMLEEYYSRWSAEPLAVLKWLSMQAMCNLEGNVKNVAKLVEHEAFTITNPNCCYSLVRAFASSPVNFHAADGSGYKFMADMCIKIDKHNAQVAARIATVFTVCAQVDTQRRELIKEQLKTMQAAPELSDNSQEIVNRCLESLA